MKFVDRLLSGIEFRPKFSSITLTCRSLSLFVALTLSARISAETPSDFTDAVRRLRDAAPYSWTINTDFPGAPFTVVPVKGTTDTHQFSVLTLGNGQGVAVARGNARVFQTAAIDVAVDFAPAPFVRLGFNLGF